MILMPTEDEAVPSQRTTKVFQSEVVRPVLEEIGFSIETGGLPKSSGISSQTIGHLLREPLVIADLTGLNPNVMYEVGVRHCVRLPLVLLAERGTAPPFEIQDEAVLFYDNNIEDKEALRSLLKQKCEKALAEKPPMNPVYTAMKSSGMKAVMGNNNIEKPDWTQSFMPRSRYARKQSMRRPTRTVPGQEVVDWMVAEGDGVAIRSLIDEIGRMGFIMAARFFDLGENKTRIEFRHPKMSPSAYIVMKYLTREGFKVIDASMNSESFNPESSAE